MLKVCFLKDYFQIAGVPHKRVLNIHKKTKIKNQIVEERTALISIKKSCFIVIF
jgi:hypothetical protein